MGETFPHWSPLFESQKYYMKPLALESSGKHKRIKDLSMAAQISGYTIDCCSIRQGKYKTTPLVCAIILLANYGQCFKKARPDPLIFPRQSSAPVYNEYGQYGVRINVNGSERLILLDDLLEVVDETTNELCNSTTSNKNEFWVPLIEKALMRLYGKALESIKTSPSFEIFHLIGWIPEIVMLADIANKENLWSRLHQNILDGNIMVALGTSEIQDPIDPAAEQKISKSTSIFFI